MGSVDVVRLCFKVSGGDVTVGMIGTSMSLPSTRCTWAVCGGCGKGQDGTAYIRTHGRDVGVRRRASFCALSLPLLRQRARRAPRGFRSREDREQMHAQLPELREGNKERRREKID